MKHPKKPQKIRQKKRLLAITGEQEKRTQPKPSKPPRKYVFQASEFKP